jgi:hypothetical protein
MVIMCLLVTHNNGLIALLPSSGLGALNTALLQMRAINSDASQYPNITYSVPTNGVVDPLGLCQQAQPVASQQIAPAVQGYGWLNTTESANTSLRFIADAYASYQYAVQTGLPFVGSGMCAVS